MRSILSTLLLAMVCTAPAAALGPSVKDYGALCDGVTDDSAALQTAINASINSGFELRLPAGRCRHSQTLTLNLGPKSAVIRGEAGQGAQGSYLFYTGSGTALLLKNGSSKGLSSYNLIVRDFGLLAGADAQIGLDANGISEAVVHNLSIMHYGSTRFALGMRCSSCALLNLDGLVLSGLDAGSEFIDSSVLFFSHLDFFQLAHYGIKFSGSTTHVVVRDSWFESIDVGLLFDTQLDFALVQGNRFLFNGGAAFKNNLAVQLLNSSNNYRSMTSLHFEHNSVYCAAGLCSAAYLIALNPGTGGSRGAFWLEHNLFQGATSGIVGWTGPPGGLSVRLTNNESYDANGTPLAAAAGAHARASEDRAPRTGRRPRAPRPTQARRPRVDRGLPGAGRAPLRAGQGESGGGLKQKRGPVGCTTVALRGRSCTSPPLPWSTPFPDANYTLACSLEAPTNSPRLLSVAKTAASFTVTIVADTNEAATARVDCIAMHDGHFEE